MMEAWSRWCSPREADNVVPLTRWRGTKDAEGARATLRGNRADLPGAVAKRPTLSAFMDQISQPPCISQVFPWLVEMRTNVTRSEASGEMARFITSWTIRKWCAEPKTLSS